MDKDKKIARWFLFIGFILVAPFVIYSVYRLALWIILMIMTRNFAVLALISFFAGALCLLIGLLAYSHNHIY